MSGTSMATPHVAGSAALAIQAHPSWQADEVSTAIVNTAPQRSWSATRRDGVAMEWCNRSRYPHLGYRARIRRGAQPELRGGRVHPGLQRPRAFTVENHGGSSASFAVSVVQGSGSPHTATVDATSVTVPGHQSRTLHLALSVPANTAGDSNAFRQVQGRSS